MKNWQILSCRGIITRWNRIPKNQPFSNHFSPFFTIFMCFIPLFFQVESPFSPRSCQRLSRELRCCGVVPSFVWVSPMFAATSYDKKVGIFHVEKVGKNLWFLGLLLGCFQVIDEARIPILSITSENQVLVLWMQGATLAGDHHTSCRGLVG